MQVFITTDIFGVSDTLLSYCQQLATNGYQVQLLDPYQGEMQNFANEQLAYQAFQENCGFETYVSNISAALAKNKQDKVILGFSVGAAATYKAIDTISDTQQSIKHFIGFYPGQIRHHLDINPSCPVTLVFPKKEQHFDLDAVISCLSEKPYLCCIQTPFEHGFMNPLSVNYRQVAANHYLLQLSGKNLQLAPQMMQALLGQKQITDTLLPHQA